MKKIPLDADHYFSAVVRNGWLGSTSPFVCKRIHMEYAGTLKPRYVGQGRATRILIAGNDIETFKKSVITHQK